ncbi:MAG TPA: hypothetical protein VK543_06280, partial [Puia sp.]|nr:hypothetical protein [Puia sp.]
MKIFLLLLAWTGYIPLLHAQTIIQKDAAIEAMVREVNADSLRSYINSLAGFGTRNTLSSVSDPAHGMGAARNWVLAKFNSFIASSNGGLTVFLDTSSYKPDGK